MKRAVIVLLALANAAIAADELEKNFSTPLAESGLIGPVKMGP